MGLRIMDPAYGRGTSVGAREQRTDDPTASSAARRWTPVSDASESFGYYVNPAMYAVPPQPRSAASSESWGTSTDGGDMFRSDGMDSAHYIHVPRGSASPNTEASNDPRASIASMATKDPSTFQSPYVSNSIAYPWSLDDGCLKPGHGPTSPALFAPPEGMSPGNHPAASSSIRTNPKYDLGSVASSGMVAEDGLLRGPYGPRSHRAPSQSPLSTSMTLVDQRPSVSPTPKVPRHSPKKGSANPANSKRPKVRRKAHNEIEKRYRIRLNDKIAELRDSIPSLRGNPASLFSGNPGDIDVGIGCGRGAAHKVNKANVLEKATEYIKNLELCNRRLQAELHRVLNLSGHPHMNRPMPPLANQFSLDTHLDSALPTQRVNHAFEPATYLDHQP